MRRSILLAQLTCLSLFAVSLAGLGAAREPVRLEHPRGWAVTAPVGWDPIGTRDAMGADFRIFGPRSLDAACAFYSRADLGLGVTNDQIRSALGASSMYDAAIIEFLQAGELWQGELSDIVVKEVRPQINHPSGWPFQRAAFTYYDGGSQSDGGNASQGWAAITFKNDTVYVAYCGASDASTADAKPIFSAILNSIEMTR